MKPFDLQKALDGADVVTRSGQKVLEITALKMETICPYTVFSFIEGQEDYYRTYTKKGKADTTVEVHGYDLFMRPYIKTYWINIYRNDEYIYNTGDTYETEAEAQQERQRRIQQGFVKQITFDIEYEISHE